MTREEAIQVLKDFCNGGWPSYYGFVSALNIAIEALSERNIARDIATIIENEQDMRVMLQNADRPTLDEVVRCKDCRWWNSETNGCNRNPSVEAWHEDDFCKYGERREP